MCGIFGVINLAKKNLGIEHKKVEIAISTMKHRGPNAQGIKHFENELTLAHLRLAIIDIKPESNQPFSIDSDRYWITYNGEIYNYLELKEELSNLGAVFFTESDTEVLLNAFKYWGEDCVNRFNGMWAFAIYDNIEKTLFCSRDRFGVKPFNYAVSNGQFIFSSEIKAILSYDSSLKVPNYDSIANYVKSSIGAQHEETWFKDVFRLQAGHNLTIKKGEISKYRYWFYPYKINNNLNFEDSKAQYLQLFNDSVKLRMRSDVPVGTTLSSGIDSSSIVSSLRTFYDKKHNTYTAAFNTEEYNILEKSQFKNKNLEINESALVLKLTDKLKLNAHFVKIEYTNALIELKKIIWHMESGNSSPAVIPLMKVMETARKEITVILEGQGADELLGGYINAMFGPVIIQYIKEFKILSLFNFIKNYSKSYSLKSSLILFFRILSDQINIIKFVYQKFTGIENVFGKKLIETKKLNDFPSYSGPKCENYVNEFLRKQHSGGLVNLLHYGDAISMANSLESRLPFMDYRLVELAFKMPWDFKVKNSLGKFIHRKALEGIVPEYILNNPIKFGFNTPISHFFSKKYEGEIKPLDLITSETFYKRGLFRKSGIEHLINEHTSGKKNHSTILFRILSVELWFNLFIDN